MYEAPSAQLLVCCYCRLLMPWSAIDDLISDVPLPWFLPLQSHRVAPVCRGHIEGTSGRAKGRGMGMAPSIYTIRQTILSYFIQLIFFFPRLTRIVFNMLRRPMSVIVFPHLLT